MKKKYSSYVELLMFTLPALISVVMITIVPFLLNIYYSFFKWNGISKNILFVGLNNFIKIFTNDARFWSSFVFTLKFSIAFLVCVNLLALFFATQLTKKSTITNVSRAFLFIPHIISLVAISLTWGFILGPGFDSLYEITGNLFFGRSWLGDPQNVYFTVVFISIWQNVGFYTIIYIAGLMAIPTDLIEAASIDGATKSRVFYKIKLPLLMPSITICTFHAITFGMKIFDIILVLTKGGPGNASESIAYHIFKEAFISDRYGMATAKSLVFFLIVLVITVLQLKVFKNKEVEY